jgi:hypothetical protein
MLPPLHPSINSFIENRKSGDDRKGWKKRGNGRRPLPLPVTATGASLTEETHHAGPNRDPELLKDQEAAFGRANYSRLPKSVAKRKPPKISRNPGEVREKCGDWAGASQESQIGEMRKHVDRRESRQTGATRGKAYPTCRGGSAVPVGRRELAVILFLNSREL